MIIDKIDKSNFKYLKDEENTKGVLGITHNRIVEIPDFLDENTAKSMISYVESKGEDWGDIAFYGSLGMGLAPNDPGLAEHGLEGNFFEDLREKFKEAVELVFERKVRPNTSHAQKWDVGGFASPHSDNSDFSGVPNAFEINKYVGILYLNDNYDGGELYFVEDSGKKSENLDMDGVPVPVWNEPYLSFKPNAYSYYVFPGGVENIHGVTEILDGTRYTMVSFWDFEEIEYDQETLDKWDEQEKEVRKQQAIQKEEWAKGNKYA
jgi:hypothetical protein